MHQALDGEEILQTIKSELVRSFTLTSVSLDGKVYVKGALP